MAASTRDYSILDKFAFERKPVGMKFFPVRPQGIPHLKKALNFCEMVKEAQNSEPFYVTSGDFHCVEPMLLGMEDPEPVLVSGLFGAKGNLFEEARACREMYFTLPKMMKGMVHSVAFASLDKLTFDPDVLTMVTSIQQAQTILRSINYTTGEMIQSKITPVVACSWLFIYPVISGEMNYVITGLSLGMSALGVFPPGLALISVPWQKLDIMLKNLREMKSLNIGKAPPNSDAHRAMVDSVMQELRQEIKK